MRELAGSSDSRQRMSEYGVWGVNLLFFLIQLSLIFFFSVICKYSSWRFESSYTRSRGRQCFFEGRYSLPNPCFSVLSTPQFSLMAPYF